MPSPGLVTAYAAPQGTNVRFDTLLFDGYKVAPFYDSLIGKLIVWAPNRDAAIAALQVALGDLKVEGIHTTASLHRALAADAEVRRGDFHTAWLEEWMTAGRM